MNRHNYIILETFLDVRCPFLNKKPIYKKVNGMTSKNWEIHKSTKKIPFVGKSHLLYCF